MSHPRFKPLGLALLFAFAAPAQAEEQAPADEPAGSMIGLKLRPQPTLQPFVPEGDTPIPVYVEADRLEGLSERQLEASGDVRLRRRGQSVHADWMLYSEPDDEIYAVGNVRMFQRGSVLEGEKMKFNLNAQTGFVEQPRYSLEQTGGYGEGKRLNFDGPGKVRFEDSNYTTCAPDAQDWVVKSGELALDRNAETGLARDATLYFHGYPIAYTPYLDFPLNNERKSGFLSPLIGTTRRTGFEVTTPYYWNIAPNRDYTFSPRFMASRGVLLGNEFRYLEPTFSGTARVEYLPYDKLADETRWAVSAIHTQSFSPEWSGYVNYQRVSDDNYFRELSNRIGLTSLTNLPEEAWLRWARGWWSVLGRVQSWQTLQDPAAVPVVPPYRRLPQLLLSGSELDVAGADFSLQAGLDNFVFPDELPGGGPAEGRRFIVYPSITYPIQNAYSYVKPKIGVSYTNYSLEPGTAPQESLDRTLPIASVDSGLIFERETKLRGTDVIQTLEPRLYYLYIPFQNQDNFPNFDTALATVNSTQLFAENRFVGGDRINNANQVTGGVTSRLIDSANGNEFLRATLAQRYYFTTERVTLPGVSARPAGSSDFIAAVGGRVAQHWTTDAAWVYQTEPSTTQRIDAAIRYQPEIGHVVNLGYRFLRDSTRQVEFSTQWPLTSRLNALARAAYSLENNTLLEGLGGIEYNAGCWSVRAVVQRFVTGATTSNSLFFLQFELTGISRVGGASFFDILNRYIPGYSRDRAPIEPQEQYFLSR